MKKTTKPKRTRPTIREVKDLTARLRNQQEMNQELQHRYAAAAVTITITKRATELKSAESAQAHLSTESQRQEADNQLLRESLRECRTLMMDISRSRALRIFAIGLHRRIWDFLRRPPAVRQPEPQVNKQPTLKEYFGLKSLPAEIKPEDVRFGDRIVFHAADHRPVEDSQCWDGVFIGWTSQKPYAGMILVQFADWTDYQEGKLDYRPLRCFTNFPIHYSKSGNTKIWTLLNLGSALLPENMDAR